MDMLQEKIRKFKCPIVLDLALEQQHIPAAMASDHMLEGMAAYCKALLNAMRNVVPAVRFSFDQYALLGGEGLQTLSALMQEANRLGYYVLLDGPAVMTPWAAQRAAALLGEDSQYPCHGMIIDAYIGGDAIKPFVEYCKSGKSLFVMIRSANKTAAELQDLMTGSRLVHTAAADIVKRYGETVLGKCGYSLIGAVTSATSSSSVTNLRSKYNRTFLLVDGLDYPGGNGKNASFGFDRFGHGCAVSVGPSITGAWMTETEETADAVELAVRAAERIRNNLNRYITIL